MTEGTLIVKTKNNKKEMRLIFTNFKGDYSQKPITEKMADQIAINLTQKITENAQQEIAVEFEENGDQISKIREKGTQWDREEQTLVSRQEKPAAALLPTPRPNEQPRLCRLGLRRRPDL
jgi:hypothetical protein